MVKACAAWECEMVVSETLLPNGAISGAKGHDRTLHYLLLAFLPIGTSFNVSLPSTARLLNRRDLNLHNHPQLDLTRFRNQSTRLGTLCGPHECDNFSNYLCWREAGSLCLTRPPARLLGQISTGNSRRKQSITRATQRDTSDSLRRGSRNGQ